MGTNREGEGDPMSDHYRYEHDRDARRVRAIVNEGHAGTVLNCPHPDCAGVAMADQTLAAGPRREPAADLTDLIVTWCRRAQALTSGRAVMRDDRVPARVLLDCAEELARALAARRDKE